MNLDRNYPVTVRLNKKDVETCKNENLKKRGTVMVDRINALKTPLTKTDLIINPTHDWIFKAFLDETEISALGANTGGICDNAQTSRKARGCGLATILMKICFSDSKVGGVDVKTDDRLKNVPLKKWREMAIENCKHIVKLQCATNFEYACSGYMTAAINTKHTMMFSYQTLKSDKSDDESDDETEIMYVNIVEKIQPEFKKRPKDWILEYGKEWYFCQCKPEKQVQCEKMQ